MEPKKKKQTNKNNNNRGSKVVKFSFQENLWKFSEESNWPNWPNKVVLQFVVVMIWGFSYIDFPSVGSEYKMNKDDNVCLLW